MKDVPDPGKPTGRGIEEIEATRVQYRSWADKHNARAKEKNPSCLAEVVMDYCFSAQQGESSIIILGMREGKYGATHALVLPNKGYDEWVIKTAVQNIDSNGHGRIILKNDGEPSIKSLQMAIQKARHAETGIDGVPRETVPENSMKGDSQSAGLQNNVCKTSRHGSGRGSRTLTKSGRCGSRTSMCCCHGYYSTRVWSSLDTKSVQTARLRARG
jgi:hypothetical protein